MTVQELTLKVVEHLSFHKSEYIHFVKLHKSDKENNAIFLKMVSEINKDGHWDNDMSDLIPLCITNIFKRE